MVAPKTLWHLMLYALLEERRPRAFEVRFEVPLAKEPQRADFILLRKRTDADLSDARVLRKLWGLIRKDALVEYKSVKRLVQPGDLTKLLGYGAQYATLQRDRLGDKRDLTLVLVLPTSTPTLSRELEFLGAALGAAEDGYAPIEGLCFPAWAVFVDDVSKAERDGLVGRLGHRRSLEGEDLRWWLEHLWNQEKIMEGINPSELEGYDEMIADFLATLTPEQRLEGLAPEEVLMQFPLEKRLEGLAPEQRLEGLAPEEVLMQFPLEKRLEGLAPEQRLEGLAPEQRLEGLSPEELETLRKLLAKKKG